MITKNQALYFIFFICVNSYFIYEGLYTNNLSPYEFIFSFFFNIQKLGFNTTIFLTAFEFNNWLPITTPMYKTRLKDSLFFYSLQKNLIKAILFTTMYIFIFLSALFITRTFTSAIEIVGIFILIYFPYSFFYFSLITLLYIITDHHTRSVLISSALLFIIMTIIIEFDCSNMSNNIGEINYIYIFVLNLLSIISIVSTGIILRKKEFL